MTLEEKMHFDTCMLCRSVLGRMHSFQETWRSRTFSSIPNPAMIKVEATDSRQEQVGHAED